MLKPKTLEDLVATVDLNGPLGERSEVLEESIEASPWATTFMRSLKTRDKQHGDEKLANMFRYYILCSNIARTTDTARVEELLHLDRRVFFTVEAQGGK